MALLFGGATSDRVNCGTGASLADITTGTLMAWVYNTATATNQRLYQKGTLGTLRRFQLTSSRFGMSLARATTNQDAQASAANFAAYATNKWICVAMAFDLAGANGDQKLYVGDLATPLAEPSAYVTQTVGSGIITTDAAETSFIGNNSATNVAWVGRMAWVGLWNRLLPFGEMYSQQFRPHVSSGCVLFMPLGLSGTGTQPDWSGNLNNGTVTGATVESGVSTLPYYGGFAGWRGAASTKKPWLYYAAQHQQAM